MLPKNKTFVLPILATVMAAGTVFAETQNVPVDKLFPYLKNYYDVPAAERTLFRTAYYLVPKGGALPPIKAKLKRKGGDFSLNVGADGEIYPLPTSDDFKNKINVELEAPKGTSIGISLRVKATIPAAQTYEVATIKSVIAQTNKGSKKAAGVAGFVIPTFKLVCFSGVTSGVWVDAAGNKTALKSEPKIKDNVVKNAPCFNPDEAPKAVSVTLDHPAKAVFIYGKAK